MNEFAAYSTVAITLGLVVARPKLGSSYRLTPAAAAFAGVLVMGVLGIVRPVHLVQAAANLWTPFVALASIMVMTEAARRSGLLDWWAAHIEARAVSTSGLFLLVFALGVLTSTAFNNDAAILLLTPVVIALVKRRYPGVPQLVLPFAFAVFMSAGVAALPVSNPMNMVVSEFLKIRFNDYALHMIPVSIAGNVVGFLILRVIFSAQLRQPIGPATQAPMPATPVQRRMMALLGCVLVSYPLFGALGVPVWPVALCGAALSVLLLRGGRSIHPVELVRNGVSWETLGFLLAVLIMSLGLRQVGLVARLEALYAGAGFATVGVVSAIGSALLNNHPMSHLNMMALESGAHSGHLGVFAALIGGDLGPRLLPIGSLAGLLWIEMLRRHGVSVSVGRFVRIGLAVAVPTIAISMLILALFGG
ncbi:MAG TPA: ArsB/NhaD family transporter [Candidatus Kapabacteria bacterium]|nr:ArsB/NhaD family transporter [Candidatus Kapabacteria bacterium]